MERSEEKKAMRIEGTYTFPGAIERVFAALTNADELGRALPGCERLIQLGPTAADGAVSLQGRVCAVPGGSPVTMTATTVAARRPAHLRLELHGRTESGPVRGSGLVDLVAQEEYTLVAYVWDVDVAGSAGNAGNIALERQRAMREAAQQYIRAACERLAGVLRAETERAAMTAALTEVQKQDKEQDHRKIVEVRTPRGKIVKLPATASATALSPEATMWMQRAAWMTTGMLIGVSAIGLLMALGRWLNDHER